MRNETRTKKSLERCCCSVERNDICIGSLYLCYGLRIFSQEENREGRVVYFSGSPLTPLVKPLLSTMTNKLPPIHPGEILLEEFLEPMGISQYRLARDINVPPRRINEIVLGKRSITPDTALRLSLFFGLSERFWMNLQTRYDIEVEKDKLENRLEQEVHVYSAA